jgi:hypothetical protein
VPIRKGKTADLKEQLKSNPAEPLSWKQTITGEVKTPELLAQEPEPSGNQLKHKTFLLSGDLIKQVAEIADQEKVGQSELVRYVLKLGLDQIASGKHKLPTEERRRITR